MNLSWTDIIALVLREAEDIHKLYSVKDGCCVLTAATGQRFRITDEMHIDYVKQVIQHIKKINAHGYYSTRQRAQVVSIVDASRL